MVISFLGTGYLMGHWTRAALASLVVTASASCVGDSVGPGPSEGARIAVAVAALGLEGVGDVVWDLEVLNGDDDVVWQRRVTSSGYGDGAGSASYVGSCDADAADNTVRVWVVGVYRDTVSDAGDFASGSDQGDGAVTGTALDLQNPTTAGPLTRDATCLANADVPVRFDVTLLRPAQQGFFDIAVNFDQIFCSAKFDCCDPGADGVCATDGSEDTALLFDADGDRARTFVLGFACTAGLAAEVDTGLYLDDLALDCDVGSDDTTFLADLVIAPDPDLPGNLCTPGADGVGSCPAISERNGADADDYLFQVAVYRGDEALTTGGSAANKVYWNVALGVKALIEDCTLRTRATADDTADDGDNLVDGVIAQGAVYPFVRFDVDLGSCAAEALTFGDPSAAVTPDYTTTGASETTTFANVFAPGCPLCGLDPQCDGPDDCVSGICAPGPDDTCASRRCADSPVVIDGATVACHQDAGVDYQLHTYTAVGAASFTPPSGVTAVELLVVAGGGGGGSSGESGSGGGAGGLIYYGPGTPNLGASYAVTPGDSYPITVGAGGAGATVVPDNPVGATGEDSTFGPLVALGGGGGVGANMNGLAGGSGSGACDAPDLMGGPATQPTSASSGFGHAGAGANAHAISGSGGGGAGAAGQVPTSSHAGNGGAGLAYGISGTTTWYGGGGGGGVRANLTVTTPGAGGQGGGGTGGPLGQPGSDGDANTGGGGGGGSGDGTGGEVDVDGGDGGSGVVIVRFPVP